MRSFDVASLMYSVSVSRMRRSVGMINQVEGECWWLMVGGLRVCLASVGLAARGFAQT